MAHTYSHLYDIPATGLRFFTVYGPWGRPDMALYKFTNSIIKGEIIEVYNNGKMIRDFTYIDDIIESIIKIIYKPATSKSDFDYKQPTPSSSWAPHRIFNIGNSSPNDLMEYINIIEKKLERKANINFLPMQPGDVAATYADTSKLEDWIGFKPRTSIDVGITKFINWYKSYHNI